MKIKSSKTILVAGVIIVLLALIIWIIIYNLPQYPPGTAAYKPVFDQKWTNNSKYTYSFNLNTDHFPTSVSYEELPSMGQNVTYGMFSTPLGLLYTLQGKNYTKFNVAFNYQVTSNSNYSGLANTYVTISFYGADSTTPDINYTQVLSSSSSEVTFNSVYYYPKYSTPPYTKYNYNGFNILIYTKNNLPSYADEKVQISNLVVTFT